MPEEKWPQGTAMRRLPESLAKIAIVLGEPSTFAAGGPVRAPSDPGDDSVPFPIGRCLHEQQELAAVRRSPTLEQAIADATPHLIGDRQPITTGRVPDPVLTADVLTAAYARILNPGLPRLPGAIVVPDDLRPRFEKLFAHAPDAAINAPGAGLPGTPVIYLQPTPQPQPRWWRRLVDRAVDQVRGRRWAAVLVAVARTAVRR